jgi:hypothetical protein
MADVRPGDCSDLVVEGTTRLPSFEHCDPGFESHSRRGCTRFLIYLFLQGVLTTLRFVVPYSLRLGRDHTALSEQWGRNAEVACEELGFAFSSVVYGL